MASYAAVLGVCIATFGLPADPIVLFVWLWLAAIAWRIDRPLRAHLTFARDWSGPVVFLLLYSYSRGIVHQLGIPVHYGFPITVDRWLGWGQLPVQRLQPAICGDSCQTAAWTPFDFVFTTTYYSHFVTAWILGVILWLRDRTAWSRWMSRFVTLNMVGLIGYVSFPMAPPWIASARGLISPALSVGVNKGWGVLGVHLAEVVRGPLDNPVAAMPSLHAATATLVALYGIQRLRGRARWLLLLYPLTMCVTLVYYAEHYVIDEIAGVLVAVGVQSCWARIERRRQTHARTDVDEGAVGGDAVSAVLAGAASSAPAALR